MTMRLPRLRGRAFRWSLRPLVRAGVRSLPWWFVAGAAIAGFWFLSHGAALPVMASENRFT